MARTKKLRFKDVPDQQKILWLLADNMTSVDIMFLAELDYGRDIEKHAERITHFKQTLETSKLDSWYPMEVWELNRWSSPGASNTLGHARRAFSCAALIACYFEGVGESIESLDTLLPLFESLVALDMPNWEKYFCAFLSEGLTKTKYPEDKFKIQLTFFLACLDKTTEVSALRARFEQLMTDEMSMLKSHWEIMWNETWDPALEPQVERPIKIVDTYISHPTAHIFAARYVFKHSEQFEDARLSEDLKNLARRLAALGKDKLGENFSSAPIYL